MTYQRKYTVICDIDNCFVDSRMLAQYIPADNSRAGWDNFLTKIPLCTPNQQVIDMICATCDLHPVIFMTGREDRHTCRHDTIVQLKEFSNGKINMQDPECPHKLLMRDEFDYRPASVIKEEKLLQVIRAGYMPLVAIDDEIENCQMFMKYGLKTIRYDIEAQLLKRCEYDTSGHGTTERTE